MRWFNNLNATPRLMISFGVLMVLTVGISFLAISSLSKANDRLTRMYEDDMAGSRQANQVEKDRLNLGRDLRDALININDSSIVEAREKNISQRLADIHATLADAEKTFNSKEGVEVISTMRSVLPDYEKSAQDTMDRLNAKDGAGAKKALDRTTAVGQSFADAVNRAINIKKQRGEEKHEANADAYRSSRLILISAVVAALAIGLILSLVISRGFSIPLGQAVVALEKVAAGDLTTVIDVETKDEVGRMAAALNKAVEMLAATLREVADSASNASSSAQQLAAATETIASGAQEQAASLEETSASLEEITATVRQSADNARQASQLATSSKDSAEHGQEVVSSAVTAMSEINVASAKISDIISTIDEIAFQTNLLAVNAAVEAARAGEEGRGFAVVASEVRSLAQRSAVAAKEIKVLIQDSLRKVEAGSELVNRSGETLQTIVGSVKRVTDIVGEIAAASGEQSTGIEQVNTAMTQMDQVTQANSAQTEELSATAQALSEQSARLLELISAFTLSRNEVGLRGRQASLAHSAGSVVSLQHGAAFHSELRSPAVHEAAVTLRQPAKSVKSNGSPKAQSRPRASKAPKSQQPALAMASPVVGSVSDASFEEF